MFFNKEPFFMASYGKRRLLRCGWWSGLVLVLLLIVPLGWLAFNLNRVKCQHESAAIIEKLGGSVRYDYQMCNGYENPG